MTTLADLLAQKEALDAQIASVRKEARVNAIAQARELISQFGLSAEDLFGKPGKAKRTPGVPRYRNPETGDTWTGQGRTPKWLEGKNKQDFAI